MSLHYDCYVGEMTLQTHYKAIQNQNIEVTEMHAVKAEYISPPCGLLDGLFEEEKRKCNKRRH